MRQTSQMNVPYRGESVVFFERKIKKIANNGEKLAICANKASEFGVQSVSVVTIKNSGR